MSFKRYNSSNSEDFRTNYVGQQGELTWDNTNGLRLHDDNTSAGARVAVFNADGSITLPSMTTTDWENGTLTGPTLQMSNDPAVNEVIITGPTPTNDYSAARRLIIQGQAGYGGENNSKGEGGDVYIWAGIGGEGGAIDPRANGGDVKLRGGKGGIEGGYIRLESGEATATNGVGGFLDLNAGNAYDTGGMGGNVNIRAGQGDTAGGTVRIYTAAQGSFTSLWTFGNDGSTTLPGKVITSTVTATSNPSAPTALDLTKTINKLSDNPGSWYTLANGDEGQIMYIVPTTGATNANTIVRVGNGRVLNAAGVTTAEVFANIAFNPFGTYSSEQPTNVVTMMFTDGAWQSSGGAWD